MAAYGTADVTYTYTDGSGRADPSNPMQRRGFTVSIGGGKTYPAGGIPLLKAKLGCAETLQQFFWLDEGSSSGLVAKFDLAATKIRLYEIVNTGTVAFTSALTEVGTAETVAATTWKVLVAGW